MHVVYDYDFTIGTSIKKITDGNDEDDCGTCCCECVLLYGDAHVTPQPAQKLRPNLRTLQRNHLPLVCCGKNAKNELFGRV